MRSVKPSVNSVTSVRVFLPPEKRRNLVRDGGAKFAVQNLRNRPAQAPPCLPGRDQGPRFEGETICRIGRPERQLLPVEPAGCARLLETARRIRRFAVPLA